jgi:acyl-[acyl-carrier-protein] desaturase
VLANVAKEEARHYTFYRSVFKGVIERDPNQGLIAASKIMPAIDMPGVNMPHFRELADVVRRAGIYGPRDYLDIVQELIKYWSIESLDGLNDLGRMAQEKIMGIPARLERIAEIMEKKTKPKSFAFDVIFNRVFAME